MKRTTSSSEDSTSDVFDDIESLCLSLELGDVESSDDRLKESAERLMKLRLDVVSENETMIDVKTIDLKGLLSDFYIAKLIMTIPNRVPEERLKALEKGRFVQSIFHKQLSLTHSFTTAQRRRTTFDSRTEWRKSKQ